MIYDKNGNELTACYDKNGNFLDYAYDKNGNQIWQSGPTRLRVMTYNVQNGGQYGNRVKRIVDEIYETELPDIVGLQETGTASSGWFTLLENGWAYNDYLGHYYGLTYSARGTSESNNVTSIISKYPISDFETVQFSVQDSQPNWREYTKCHIVVGGKQVLWYNTHLGLGLTYRAIMRDELLADVEEAMETEDYIILTGDFNVQVATTETTDSEFYAEQIQPFIDAGLTLANWQEFGMIPTFTSTTDGVGEWRCLDNIMVSPNITIEDAWTNTAKVDDNQEGYQIDHIPFIADLVLN